MKTRLALFSAAAALAGSSFGANAPIPIAELKRTESVSFDRDVLPFLNDNCLACHCQTTKKGGLNMETPELMLKGGENGAAIVPKKGADSLLLQAAAHLDADLAMPPRDNKAKAKNLTSEQLALLKLWIDQGAKPSPKVERKLDWQAMPATLGAIFGVAVTADGQFAACSRADRVFIYHLPTGRAVLNEVAHRDQVNAVAFNPEGTLLATGGYREVKLWRRVPIEGKPAEPVTAATGKIARADGKRVVTLEGNVAKLADAEGKLIAELRGNRFAREASDERDRALQVEVGNVAYRKEVAAAATKTRQAAQDRMKKSADAIAPKEQELTAKQKALADATAAKMPLEATLAATVAELAKADALVQAAATKAAQLSNSATEAIKGAAAADAGKLAGDAAAALQEAAKARTDRDQREAQRKQAADKLDATNKQIADAEEAAKKAETAKTVAATELDLA
ncbi:MAG: c-type cytochrome domain-containing protein, partial [Chthoniobacteraceae bacterium]